MHVATALSVLQSLLQLATMTTRDPMEMESYTFVWSGTREMKARISGPWWSG